MTNFDVAVIGYGPTGMTLAALLGQSGHRVVVLERYDGLYNLPRAACFDDEIIRTFQKLGLTDAISDGAVAQRDYDWLNADGETLVEIEYPDPGPGGWMRSAAATSSPPGSHPGRAAGTPARPARLRPGRTGATHHLPEAARARLREMRRGTARGARATRRRLPLACILYCLTPSAIQQPRQPQRQARE